MVRISIKIAALTPYFKTLIHKLIILYYKKYLIISANGEDIGSRGHHLGTVLLSCNTKLTIFRPPPSPCITRRGESDTKLTIFIPPTQSSYCIINEQPLMYVKTLIYKIVICAQKIIWSSQLMGWMVDQRWHHLPMKINETLFLWKSISLCVSYDMIMQGRRWGYPKRVIIDEIGMDRFVKDSVSELSKVYQQILSDLLNQFDKDIYSSHTNNIENCLLTDRTNWPTTRYT